MRRVADIARALGDESRLRALVAVSREELCLCQLVELLGLAPSTVSKHLSVLLRAGLVERRKEGRWVFFRTVGERGPETVRRAVSWAVEEASRGRQAAADTAALERIRGRDLEELASCYRG